MGQKNVMRPSFAQCRVKKPQRNRFRECYKSICITEGKEGAILNLRPLKLHFYGLIFILKQKIKCFITVLFSVCIYFTFR